jgi:hypothetical protein
MFAAAGSQIHRRTAWGVQRVEDGLFSGGPSARRRRVGHGGRGRNFRESMATTCHTPMVKLEKREGRRAKSAEMRQKWDSSWSVSVASPEAYNVGYTRPAIGYPPSIQGWPPAGRGKVGHGGPY